MRPRINLFGGPGVGKSTLAAKMYTQLKQEGVNIELVREDVKLWAYEQRFITLWDSVGLFGRQFEAEYRLLQLGVQPIITDSPLLLSCFYSQKVHGCPVYPELTAICNRFEKTYPSINFFLTRPPHYYNRNGRYQSEEGALKLDKQLHLYLLTHGIKCHDIRPNLESSVQTAILEILEHQ